MKYLTDEEIHEQAKGYAGSDKKAYEQFKGRLLRERFHQQSLESELAEAAKAGWQATSKDFRNMWLIETTNWEATSEAEADNSVLLDLYELDAELASQGIQAEDYLGEDLSTFVNGAPCYQREIGTVKEATFIKTAQGRLIAHDYRADEENDAKAIAAKWNWCLENCKGTWVISHRQGEEDRYGFRDIIWSVSIADEAEAARFQVAF